GTDICKCTPAVPNDKCPNAECNINQQQMALLTCAPSPTCVQDGVAVPGGIYTIEGSEETGYHVHVPVGICYNPQGVPSYTLRMSVCTSNSMLAVSTALNLGGDVQNDCAGPGTWQHTE